MCAEQIVRPAPTGKNATQSLTEKEISRFISRSGIASTAPPYKVLEILPENIFYRERTPARESLRRECAMTNDVQRLNFDSYLYQAVVMMNPWQQIKLDAAHLVPYCVPRLAPDRAYKPVPSAAETEEEMAAQRLHLSMRGNSPPQQ